MSRDGEPRDGYQQYRYQGTPFEAMLEDVTFDVIGFDHRVSDLNVQVVTRPSIADVQLDCELPAYLNQPSRRLTWRPGTSLPMGTRVRLTAQVTKPLQRVTVAAAGSGPAIEIDVPSSPDATTFTYTLEPLQATAAWSSTYSIWTM